MILLRIWMKSCVNHLRGHSPPCSTPPPTAPTPPTLSVLSFTSNVTTTFYCQQSITISYLYVHYSYALESKLVLSASSPTLWAVEHLAREVVSGKTTTEHIATFKSGKGEEHQNDFWGLVWHWALKTFFQWKLWQWWWWWSDCNNSVSKLDEISRLRWMPVGRQQTSPDSSQSLDDHHHDGDDEKYNQQTALKVCCCWKWWLSSW